MSVFFLVRIQSKCEKVRTRKTLNTATVHPVHVETVVACIRTVGSTSGQFPSGLLSTAIFQKSAVTVTLYVQCTLCKIWSFPLRISQVNVNKSAGNCEFGSISWRNLSWKTSLFVQSCWTKNFLRRKLCI